MRSILAPLRRHMVAKIFVPIALVIVVALGTLASVQGAQGIAALRDGRRVSATELADFIVNSIEHAMLQGEGITVIELVRGFKARVGEATIQIYDPRGNEVFSPKPTPPDRGRLRPPVALALSDGRPSTDDRGRFLHPVANEPRCHACHDPAPALRGLLELEPAKDLGLADRRRAMTRLVRAGFVQVMTARQAKRLAAYFEELARPGTGIQGVAIYDHAGELAFGDAVPGVTAPLLGRLLSPGASPLSLTHASGTVELVPLLKSERCMHCHEDAYPVRGVLALSLGPVAGAPAGGAEAYPAARAAAEVESLLDTSLRAIMLSSMGRMIVAFLHEAFATGLLRSLVLYDDSGRTYFTDRPTVPSPHIKATLATATASASFIGTGEDQRVLIVAPLSNKKRCVTCHGSAAPLRGAVSVSLPTGVAAAVRRTTIHQTVALTVAALAALLVAVFLLLKSLVIAPLRRISRAAERIGQGDLEVAVAGARTDGDEVERLGSRINEMVAGLRARFLLERFVSKGTAAAAAKAAVAAGAGARRTHGERLRATVLFSDIRGFTAYSETVPPEQVVEMLNRFLQAQAEVIEVRGGDIDKFVGDELMAVFLGPGSERQAVECALELIAATDRARRPDETLQVGVGVAAGEMIYGPIGWHNRMDFTVIGDVVNTGARLCAAAAGREVIVSGEVREAYGALDGAVDFELLEPLSLKGKRELLTVFRARPRVGGPESETTPDIGPAR